MYQLTSSVKASQPFQSLSLSEIVTRVFHDHRVTLHQHGQVLLQEAMEIKASFEETQETTTSNVFTCLRNITFIQSGVQYELKKGLEWMKKLSQGRNEYFTHLQSIAELPQLYQSFLHEIQRRHQFNHCFEHEVQSTSQRVTELRAKEVSYREKFMEQIGFRLPPIFFHLVPSLKEKPPYFNPVVTEFQYLPTIETLALENEESAFSVPTSSTEQILRERLEQENERLRQEIQTLQLRNASLEVSILKGIGFFSVF